MWQYFCMCSHYIALIVFVLLSTYNHSAVFILASRLPFSNKLKWVELSHIRDIAIFWKSGIFNAQSAQYFSLRIPGIWLAEGERRADSSQLRTTAGGGQVLEVLGWRERWRWEWWEEQRGRLWVLTPTTRRTTAASHPHCSSPHVAYTHRPQRCTSRNTPVNTAAS